jgi:DNA-binding protein HU-beta
MASKPTTKSALIKSLAEQTELSKKQIVAVLDALSESIKKDLRNKSIGVFTVPGLVKFKLVMNPFTKQMQFFPAKPAKKVVKAAPVKAMKDFAATVK